MMRQQFTRVEADEDARFRQEVLAERGAYLVDGKLHCEFKMLDARSAQMRWEEGVDPLQAIEAFRFYSFNITRFVDQEGRIVAAFPEVPLFWLGLDQIQPSQFYVSDAKLARVETFIHSEAEIIIPVMRHGKRWAAMDGHTRLYLAVTRGYARVRAYEEESDEEIAYFIKEAEKRGIREPKDMALVPAVVFHEKWDGFCDAYFASRQR